eukprot:2027192-Amphidinium_carterae.1
MIFRVFILSVLPGSGLDSRAAKWGCPPVCYRSAEGGSRHASEVLRSDREVVLAGVQEDGCALKYASEALRSDPEVVLTAVQQHGLALEFASEALKSDREMVLAAVR